MSVQNSNQLEIAADAARWRELMALLHSKAYKTTMTPAEIAAQLPNLREIYRATQRQPDRFSARVSLR
jgi:hypothetical protein